jgi:tRNA A-37 threonylcarbamoyl transferase component Bud32
MEPTAACPSCGKALEPNAPQGLCPTCLLEAGFPTGTGTAGSARFVPPKIEELAAKFSGLEILEFVGQGGMGAVYKARQRQLDRIVALKILPPQAGRGLDFAERFAREARALAKLNHPHIVTLYEFGRADGLFYFLMEFVDGLNLRQVLAAGRLAPKEALAIVPQVCDALQYAHDRGIVHRDIKPENILLSKEGGVKIADFGVAKIVGQDSSENVGKPAGEAVDLTQAGSTLGTPQYMAPEQLKNSGDVDHRADIYSLGVVLYQMLTGELPKGKFESPSRKVAIDVRLDEVVLRALEKEPERRYQRVSDVRERIETITHTPTAPVSSVGDQRPENRGQRTVLLVVGLAVVAIAFAFIVAIHRAREARRAEAAAVAAARTAGTLSNLPGRRPSAFVETWVPTIAPGEKPDLRKILDEAKPLMEQGQYDAALQRYIWYYNHVLELGDTYQRSHRRYSGLYHDWAELGRRYPKAREALVELGDHDTQEFSAGHGYFELFNEIFNVNRALQQDDATVALFKSIQADKQLAQKCFVLVDALLIERGDYALCLSYIGEPKAAVESYRQQRERLKEWENRQSAARQAMVERMQAMRKTNSLAASVPDYRPPEPPQAADRIFVDQCCRLVEALVGAGRKEDAEKIRDQALAILDNPRLKSAVSDAEVRVKERINNNKKQ